MEDSHNDRAITRGCTKRCPGRIQDTCQMYIQEIPNKIRIKYIEFNLSRKKKLQVLLSLVIIGGLLTAYTANCISCGLRHFLLHTLVPQ